VFNIPIVECGKLKITKFELRLEDIGGKFSEDLESRVPNGGRLSLHVRWYSVRNDSNVCVSFIVDLFNGDCST
jgi:hypothetical protein